MNEAKAFEQLVAVIERVVSQSPNVEVLHNVKLPTRYGGERQIDVLIKEKTERFTYKTIVECKNTNSKVSVNTVGAFKELIESVGAHQGIIVSASGFQKGALLSAKEANIHLFQLGQTKELEEHLSVRKFIYFELHHTSKSITVWFRQPNRINDSVRIASQLYIPNTDQITTLADIAQDFLNKNQSEIADKMGQQVKNILEPQITEGKLTIKINFPVPLLFKLGSETTEVTGFISEVQTQLVTGPSQILGAKEYKDIVHHKTHAVVIEVEYNNSIYHIVRTDSI